MTLPLILPPVSAARNGPRHPKGIRPHVHPLPERDHARIGGDDVPLRCAARDQNAAGSRHAQTLKSAPRRPVRRAAKRTRRQRAAGKRTGPHGLKLGARDPAARDPAERRRRSARSAPRCRPASRSPGWRRERRSRRRPPAREPRRPPQPASRRAHRTRRIPPLRISHGSAIWGRSAAASRAGTGGRLRFRPSVLRDDARRGLRAPTVRAVQRLRPRWLMVLPAC